MRRQHATGMALLFLLALAGGGCRKKKAAPVESQATLGKPAKPTISCPGHDELVKALGAGSAVHTGCIAYGESMFWLAGALVRDPKLPDGVRLALVTGSPHAPWTVYDVDPAPLAALKTLVAGSEDVQLQVRGGRRERRLVRIGVVGRTKKSLPDSQEVITLLKLGAHAPPEVVWMGSGDEVTSTAGGCVSERSVDFELLFGTRLEMFSSGKQRKPGPDCPRGMDTQETLPSRAVRLAKGRTVGGPGDAGAR